MQSEVNISTPSNNTAPPTRLTLTTSSPSRGCARDVNIGFVDLIQHDKRVKDLL
ncbi:hypothetical protein DPMN_074142 [Dreissena polymorpha]|uniref:Uncharacterized protein n=1 Tax=Dreissena polymorpha TaxID=45954 RepID=A0A9D3YI25_DREPO|nr:hypothetical protein DPMN_074142 [Dreissena polymorpha]